MSLKRKLFIKSGLSKKRGIWSEKKKNKKTEAHKLLSVGLKDFTTGLQTEHESPKFRAVKHKNFISVLILVVMYLHWCDIWLLFQAKNP